MQDGKYIPTLLPFLLPNVDDFYVYGSVKHDETQANDIDVRVLIVSQKKRELFKTGLKKMGFENKVLGTGYYSITYTNQLKGSLNGQKYDITISADKKDFKNDKWLEENVLCYINNREDRCRITSAFQWYNTHNKPSFWERIFK